MTPLIAEVMGWSPDLADVFLEHGFKWFDVSGVVTRNPYSMKDNQMNTPLPFPRTVLVSTDVDGSKSMLALSENHDLPDFEGGVAVNGWLQMHGQKEISRLPNFVYAPHVVPQAIEVMVFDDDYERIDPSQLSHPEQTAIQVSLSVIGMFLEATETQTLQAYEPVRKANHNKRIRQGKKPLFEWRTVIVEPIKLKREHQGGTHASPRQHERRGHWRHMKKSGKRVWVRDCKVGNAANGVVFHDYKVKGE